MRINTVEAAIWKIRDVVREWDDVELDYWREDHTRYGVIDPVIRSLGWDTSDPKVCHPEYPRSYQTGRRADYAMFGTPDVQAIGNNSVPPDIIIESKPLRAVLDDAVAQLRRYTWASPRMQRGRSVLTNGISGGSMTWPFQAHLPPGWWVRSTFLRTTLLPRPRHWTSGRDVQRSDDFCAGVRPSRVYLGVTDPWKRKARQNAGP